MISVFKLKSKSEEVEAHRKAMERLNGLINTGKAALQVDIDSLTLEDEFKDQLKNFNKTLTLLGEVYKDEQALGNIPPNVIPE